MSNPVSSQSEMPTGVIYTITLEGRLSRWRSEWFDGMTLTWDEDGHTVITGSVVDQAALYGLLRKVRDLGLPLLSVNRIDSADDA